VFNQLDCNHSGSIEVDELNLMFTYYGIAITRSELVRLFNLVDRDGSGNLDLEEFKAFAQDPKSNGVFKSLIQRMRAEHEKRFGEGRVKTYLPFCITKLLEHLSYLGRRETIFEELRSRPMGKEGHSPLQTMKNFIKLFLLNQENAMATNVPTHYDNSIITKLLQEKRPSGKTESERLEEMSQQIIEEWAQ